MNDPSEYFSRHPGRYAISVAAPVAVGGYAAVRARRAPSAAKRCLFGVLAVLMAAELIALFAARPRVCAPVQGVSSRARSLRRKT